MSAVFRVSAYRRDGTIIQERIESVSQAEAVASLLRQGLTPFQIDEASVRTPDRLAKARHLPAQQMLEFCRSLGALLNGGLVLDEALGLVAREMTNKQARALAEDVRGGVVAGNTLSEALRRSRLPPAPFITGLIEAGEASGSLGPVFARLVDYLEKEAKLKESIRSALVYPVILSITAIAAILLILLVVAPTLKPVLLAGGGTVPAAAARLVAVSDFLLEWGTSLLLAGLTCGLGIRALVQTPAGKRLSGRAIYGLPLVGDTIQEVEASRFLTSLSALLENGLPLVPAMQVANSGIATRSVKAGLDNAADLVRQGASLSAALEATHVFPPLAAHMASVAERSGNAPGQLAQAARIFEASAQQRMTRIMALVPPVMTLSLGMVIGFVVLTLLGAVMSINDLAV